MSVLAGTRSDASYRKWLRPMTSRRISKKKPGEINRDRLTEPVLQQIDWNEYRRGWDLFNKKRFWDAHEAWEAVWLRVPDESRIFFQGIIQVAAAFHLVLEKKRYGGALRNLEKAEEKLMLFPAMFLGVSVVDLLETIRSAKMELMAKGSAGISRFDPSSIRFVLLLE